MSSARLLKTDCIFLDPRVTQTNIHVFILLADLGNFFFNKMRFSRINI